MKCGAGKKIGKAAHLKFLDKRGKKCYNNFQEEQKEVIALTKETKKRNDVRVASSISAEDRELLDKYCAENDTTISQLLRKLIHDFFAEK